MSLSCVVVVVAKAFVFIRDKIEVLLIAAAVISDGDMGPVRMGNDVIRSKDMVVKLSGGKEGQPIP